MRKPDRCWCNPDRLRPQNRQSYEHYDSILAVNLCELLGGTSRGHGTGVLASNSSVSGQSTGHQVDVARSCIVVRYEVVVMVTVSLNVNVSIVQIAGIGDQSAALQVLNRAIIGLDGNILRTIPSSNDVLGAIVGILNNVVHNYCVVVIAAAGGALLQVDECYLSVVGVAGLVSNSSYIADSLVVVSSGLAGDYLVISVSAGSSCLVLNEYNAGGFVVQTGQIGGAFFRPLVSAWV